MPLRMVPGKRWNLASKEVKKLCLGLGGPKWGPLAIMVAPEQEGDSGTRETIALVLCPGPGPWRSHSLGRSQLHAHSVEALPGSGEKKLAGRGPGPGISKDAFPSSGSLSSCLPHSFVQEDPTAPQ